MKKILIGLFSVLISMTTVAGQDILGKWHGALNIGGKQLRLSFDISKTDTGYSSTMDSHDQRSFGTPVPTTKFENDTLTIVFPAIMLEYRGVLDENQKIAGTLKQAGMTMSLNFGREEILSEKPKRPQEPQKPYSYHSEDVIFENQSAGITLAGTLTLPEKEGEFPAVVLITGSGTQNRDEEVMGHKPFLVISDYLTRNGIAVLRFDDRGAGGSQGNPLTATSADYATDVDAAVRYLLTRREIEKNKIGLIGHSEGGMIAPVVENNNSNINFMVLMAGPGIPGKELLLLQQEKIGRAMGTDEEDLQRTLEINSRIFDMVTDSSPDNIEQLKSDIAVTLRDYIENLPETERPKDAEKENFIRSQVSQITSPWMAYFLKYDPAPALRKVKCPVLAINGRRDLQVPSRINLDAIGEALKNSESSNSLTIEFLNLNHLFQECETGLPSEYEKIEQTFSPEVMSSILEWIKSQIN